MQQLGLCAISAELYFLLILKSFMGWQRWGCVNLEVFHEVTFVKESVGAMDTFEWLFSRVFPNVPLQLSSGCAFILASVAFVWPLFSVLPPHVHL